MFRSKSSFEKVLEKATSTMLLEPDFDSMLQLCDMIRGGDIKAREAASLMRARVIEEKNPNVQYFALCVLDTAMKNCGEAIHEEILTESFLEKMKDIAKTSSADKVKEQVLEMIQSWGIAFKEKLDFRIATNLYNGMKAEGFKFGAPIDTKDMFKSEKAPVWKEGDECMNCKVEFGLVQRKHHCRACGGIFCNRCTTKQSIIPKFGIEKEVRVCDKCHVEINGTGGSAGKSSYKESSDGSLPAEYLNSALAKESQLPTPRDEQALREEEELQVALALSLNEQENRHVTHKEVKKDSSPNIILPKQEVKTSEPEMDPELARYLNRSYWENKKDDQVKTSDTKTKQKHQEKEEKISVEKEESVEVEPPKENGSMQRNGYEEEKEQEEFLHNLRTSVEIFMNRMRSDQMRNRSIANDSSVQSLFQTINQMHPQLLNMMSSLEDERLHYEALQDKLTQIRDARAALDALRQEHADKMKRAAEEAERQRQIQMAHKLHIMRQKKQEYLAYQRQLALQRMQEQEAARQARLEQHKQFIMQRAMQPPMVVPNYNYAPAGQVQMNPQHGMPPTQQAADYHQYQGQQQSYVEYQMPQSTYAQTPPQRQPYQAVQNPMQHVYTNDPAVSMQTANQQIVATAPPPTPQATPQPTNIAPQPHDPTTMYTAAPTQIPQNAVQAPTNDMSNLLISFD